MRKVVMKTMTTTTMVRKVHKMLEILPSVPSEVALSFHTAYSWLKPDFRVWPLGAQRPHPDIALPPPPIYRTICGLLAASGKLVHSVPPSLLLLLPSSYPTPHHHYCILPDYHSSPLPFAFNSFSVIHFPVVRFCEVLYKWIHVSR